MSSFGINVWVEKEIHSNILIDERHIMSESGGVIYLCVLQDPKV